MALEQQRRGAARHRFGSQKGELLMLMGPSGSGKTTLISVIAGILTQTEGKCLLSGLDLNHMPDQKKPITEGSISDLSFKLLISFRCLRCAENVAIPLAIIGTKDRAAALEKAKELLTMSESQRKTMCLLQNFQEGSNNGLRLQGP